MLVFNLDDSGRFRRETDMSISGNIRTYIFGMGKQDETEADRRCSVQDLTEDLQIQKSGQKGLRKRRNQEEFQEKP